MVWKIIGLILWAIAAINIFNNYKGIIYISTKGLGRFLVYLLVIATAPILVGNVIVTYMFDWILPEGWIVGDDEFFNQEEDNSE